MRTNKVTRLVLLFAIGSGLAAASTAATELAGNVQELGRPAGKNGVSGVFIQIKDNGGAVLATGTTDGAGQYRIPLQAGVVAKNMEFKKIKFRALPTIRPVTDPRNLQRTVFMIREGQRDEYYAAVWQEVSTLQGRDQASALGVIASLDPSDQGRVYAFRNRRFPETIELAEDRIEGEGPSARAELNVEMRRFEGTRLASAGDSEGRLRLVPPGDPAFAGAGTFDTAEIASLQDRVRELEGQVSESRRLLELRNTELADLQAKLAASQQSVAPRAVPRPAATSEDAVPEKPR